MTKTSILLGACLSAFALSGCASTGAPGRVLSEAPPAFYFGADLSYVNEMEDCGAVYRVGEQAQDPYRLFADIGTNLVRVRIWNDAKWTPYSNLNDVKETIRRAKQAGMQVLLDFHYSDDWADGDHQSVPAAWRAIKDDTPALSQALYDYTRQTLKALDDDGLMPEMVQVGNETNVALMGENTRDDATRPTDWTRNAALFNAGIRAVHDAGADSAIKPRIMLHVAQPENVEDWFAKADAAGVTGYDVIGISYYHRWSRETLDGLQSTIRRLRAGRPSTDVIVVETGYPFTLEGADQANNLLGEPLLAGYPATPEGQLKFLTDITQMTMDAGGVGVVTWEPAWVSTRCKTRWATGSDWENATYFDWKNGNELTPGGRWAQQTYRMPATR